MATRNREGLGGERHKVTVRNYEVVDGDTIRFTDDFRIAGKDRVHLHGVDAPEMGHIITPGHNGHFDHAGGRFHFRAGQEVDVGEVARRHMEHLCDEQPIDIYNMFWDRFYSAPDPDNPDKRQTGNIYADVSAHSRQYGAGSRTNLNFTMVGIGFARVHTYYDDKHIDTEEWAKRYRSGIWGLLPLNEEWSPLAWRREQRKQRELDRHHEEESSETTDRLVLNEEWASISDEDYAKLSDANKAKVDAIRENLRKTRERIEWEKSQRVYVDGREESSDSDSDSDSSE